MKAMRLESPKVFKQIEVSEPCRPGSGEALVRVHQVGVCGTDISGYLGKMPFFSYPRIPGHELGVEVIEVGDKVSNVRPGGRCSVEPYLNCGQCYACRRGFTNCCETLQTFGVHCDGGLRPRFIIAARKLHPSQTLSYEQLALVETLAIGCHAVQRAQVAPGENCLVIGAGPIGLTVVEFARLAGARVTVLDINEQRLEFCRRVMGIDCTLKPSNDTDVQLCKLLDGRLPDAVFDATGNATSMSSAFRWVTHGGGRLVFVGITTEEVRISHPPIHRTEATLLCSRNARAADFTHIIQLIEQGRLDTQPWITHRTKFEDVPDAFPSFVRPETGVVKAMIAIKD